jgi:hypothetical protein
MGFRAICPESRAKCFGLTFCFAYVHYPRMAMDNVPAFLPETTNFRNNVERLAFFNELLSTWPYSTSEETRDED